MATSKKSRVPKLRLHKRSGQAYVEINGVRHYGLGKFGEPGTHRNYLALLAEVSSSGGVLPVPQDEITVEELCDRYLTYCEGYYVDASGCFPTSTQHITKSALSTVASLYASIPAKDFRPLCLKAVRQVWIDADLSTTTINNYSGIIRRMYRWASCEDLIPPSAYEHLCHLPGVRRGRGMGKDPKPREVVPMDHVNKVLEVVPTPLQALIRLQLYTGARPSELLNLKRGDIDCTGEVWVSILREHKTMHRGKERRLVFGPRAGGGGGGVLRPFLLRADDVYLFSPIEAEAERHAKCKTHRRPKQGRNKKIGVRVVGDHYRSDSYRKAITRVCKELGIVPAWTPYQLRHTSATMIEASADLETAKAILGHSSVTMTERYVHKDLASSIKWAAEHG